MREVDRPGLALLVRGGDASGERAAGALEHRLRAGGRVVQPALLACDVAAFRVLQAAGLTDVAGVAGHSLGEFAALVAADAIVLADALELVVVRGEAMQRAGHGVVEQLGGALERTMTALEPYLMQLRIEMGAANA